MPNMRIWELLVAIGTIGLLAAVFFLPALSRVRESGRCCTCQNNLKQMGLVLAMYAIESKGMYPPVSPVPDNWMVSMAAVYPEYLTDPVILICPDSPLNHRGTFTLKGNIEHPGAPIGAFHPDCVTSLFYIYTGYRLLGDEPARVLGNARKALPKGWLGSADIDVTGAKGEDAASPVPVPRLTDPDGDESLRSRVPVMWDRIGTAKDDSNHKPAGSNVVYADGRVEFKKYRDRNKPDDFPVTHEAAEVFGDGVPQLSSDCQE
jgi:prepilin-type processing-associated H-X9-DG protein